MRPCSLPSTLPDGRVSTAVAVEEAGSHLCFRKRRASLVRKREAGILQRQYWEHTIRDDQDYAVNMDYIPSDWVLNWPTPASDCRAEAMD